MNPELEQEMARTQIEIARTQLTIMKRLAVQRDHIIALLAAAVVLVLAFIASSVGQIMLAHADHRAEALGWSALPLVLIGGAAVIAMAAVTTQWCRARWRDQSAQTTATTAELPAHEQAQAPERERSAA